MNYQSLPFKQSHEHSWFTYCCALLFFVLVWAATVGRAYGEDGKAVVGFTPSETSLQCPAVSFSPKDQLLVGVNTVSGELRCQCLTPRKNDAGLRMDPEPASPSLKFRFSIAAGTTLETWKESNHFDFTAEGSFAKIFSAAASYSESYTSDVSRYQEYGTALASLSESSGRRYERGTVELSEAGTYAIEHHAWLAMCGNAVITEIIRAATRRTEFKSETADSIDTITKVFSGSAGGAYKLVSGSMDGGAKKDATHVLDGYSIAQNEEDSGIPPSGVRLTPVHSLSDMITAASRFKDEMGDHPIDTAKASTEMRVSEYAAFDGIAASSEQGGQKADEYLAKRFYNQALERLAGLHFIHDHTALFGDPPAFSIQAEMDSLSAQVLGDHPPIFQLLDRCLLDDKSCEEFRKLANSAVPPLPPPATAITVRFDAASRFYTAAGLMTGTTVSIPCDSYQRRWFLSLNGDLLAWFNPSRPETLNATSPQLSLIVNGLSSPVPPINAPGHLVEVPAGSSVSIGIPLYPLARAQCVTPSCMQVVAFTDVNKEQVSGARRPAWPPSTCASAPKYYGVEETEAIPPGFAPSRPPTDMKSPDSSTGKQRSNQSPN